MTEPNQHADGNLIGSLGEILAGAVRAYEDGDLARAEEILRQVNHAQPEVAVAWHIRGMTAYKQRDLPKASEFLNKAVTLEPENPHFQRDLGMFAGSLGEMSTAYSALTKSAELRPDDSATQFHLANTLTALNRLTEAVTHYRKCVSLQPDAYEAFNNLAAVLRNTGDWQEAIDVAKHALQLNPDYPEAMNNLALALCDAGDYSAAIDNFRRALAFKSDDPEILNNLGVALQASRDWEEAESTLRRALEIRSDWPEAWISLGNLLRERNRLDEAVTCYRTALAHNPADVPAYANLGLALLNLNDPSAAIAIYEKALTLNPEQADIRMSLGIAQLMLGDYSQGWENYEYRWQAQHFTARRRNFNSPPWSGEPLAGKRILIHAEQGFGDTLQFCRYAALLAENGAQVHLECQRALATLCETIPGVDSVIIRGDPLPDVDYSAPLLSLPRLVGTTLETIPNNIPYLRADPSATELFRQQLEPRRCAVGLVWTGNPERMDDAIRSCPEDALAPLSEVDATQLISLQVGLPASGIMKNAADFGKNCKTFADTAAAINALDLVITVDTATAHLAGALGKPVWVMLGRNADWRYFMERSDSPWYPTMRLFRQTTSGDWRGLTATVAMHLDQTVQSFRDEGS